MVIFSSMMYLFYSIASRKNHTMDLRMTPH